MVFAAEIPWLDPLAAAAQWAAAPVMAFLDSAGPLMPRARFSYLAVEPFATLAFVGGRTLRDGEAVPGEPFAVLEGMLSRHRRARSDLPAPFAGGAVGFFGYETGRFCDCQPARRPAAPEVPECFFGLYDTVIAFDREARRATILCAGLDLPDRPRPEIRAARIAARLGAARLPARLPALPPPPPRLWRPEIDAARYRRRVARVRAFIRAGDIFQANFTTRFTAPRAGLHGFDLYRALRAESPAPFAAYLACGADFALASASPERFLRLFADGRVETRPIKGTRPRGADPLADAALALALAASPKDRAENLMIVDVLRNDLGRVAEIGSIRVPELCALESFASVHHLVSAVEARLRPGVGPIGLLRATFPGGSITGAPKIRAMEIIDALESSRRDAYCGMAGWIGFDGAMDSSIVIRTLAMTRTEIVAQAGGGIVADSDPAAEYAEMRAKIAPLLRTLGGRIEEGHDLAERTPDAAV